MGERTPKVPIVLKESTLTKHRKRVSDSFSRQRHLTQTTKYYIPFMPFATSPTPSHSHSLGLLLQPQQRPMERDGVVSKPVAVVASVSMALLYVAILYAPTMVLRLPPPSSFESFMIRRFLCAVVSSILSLFLSSLILPVCTLPLQFSFFFIIKLKLVMYF